MKTPVYKALRISCSFFIVILTATNTAGLLYSWYHYETLSIESAILLNSRYSLKNFIKMLIYSNLFIAFLSSYAFNIGYNFLMSLSMWVAVVVEIVGIYSVMYFREKGSSPLISRLNYGVLNNPELVFRLLDYSSHTIPEEAQSHFVREFTTVKNYFIVAEIISLVGVLIIAAGLFIGQHIKIEKVATPTPIIIGTVAGLNAESLRKKLVVTNPT